MVRSALGILALVMATAATAHADDPNRWQGWVTPDDGQSKGLDVSMVTGSPNTCGKKPFITLQPRYRSRYQEHVAGHLKVDHLGVDGPHSVTMEFDLQPGETKILTSAAFCQDPRASLVFTIADLHFPEREAEQARIAAQKAAADKAAADQAAAQKAAKEKHDAEVAAEEAARRAKAKEEADRLAKQGEAERQRAAQGLAAGKQQSEAERNQQLEAAQYREKRQADASLEANRNIPVDDLVAGDQFRNGEVNLAAPLGFESTNYGSGGEGRFSYGVRGELRLFTWLTKIREPGRPITGNGLELTINGGFGATLELGSRTSNSKTSISGGHIHARYWHGSLGVGGFGEWTHVSHDPGGGAAMESQDLFALGPELAFGLVQSRALAVEAGLRAGAVASGGGLTFDTSNDLFVGASILAELNKFYAGAFASRFVTSNAIQNTWSAVGVLGVRLPF